MLRGWFESTFGDGALAAQFVAALVFLVLLLAVLAWFFGKRSGRGGPRGLTRGRQPRLSVMEAAVVDSKRRLVLIRRDQIEHLVMIGGPSDIVVETNIIRGRPAAHAHPGRRPVPGQRPQVQPAASQPSAPARQMPAAAMAATSAAATAAAVLARPGNEPGPAPTDGADAGEHVARLHVERLAHRQPDGIRRPESEVADDEPLSAPAPDRPEPDVDFDLAAPGIEVRQAPASAESGVEMPQAPEHEGGATSAVAFAGLAAGAAALAAAAGSKSSEQEHEPEPAAVAGGFGSGEPPETASDAPADLHAAEPEPDEPAGLHAAEPEPEELTATPMATDEPISEPADSAPVEQQDEAVEALEPASAEKPPHADPFADLESEFKKAFETSLQDLKAEVHSDSATPETAAPDAGEPEAVLAEPDLPHSVAAEPDRLPADDQEAQSVTRDIPEESGIETPAEQTLEQGMAIPADDDSSEELAEDVTAETAEPVYETMNIGLKQFPADDTFERETLQPEEPEEEHAGPEAILSEPVHEERDAGIAVHAPESGAGLRSDMPASESAMEDAMPLAADDAVATTLPPTEPEAEAAIDEQVEEAEEERLESGLPPELAFLDSPAEEAQPEPDVAIETPPEEHEQPAAESPVAEEPSKPTPTSPFPTIPESVRQSVMAAASRPVPPEIAAGLADGAAKDVATTTLGDLAQRLEQALSEQTEPTGDAADTEAALDLEEFDEGDPAGTEHAGEPAIQDAGPDELDSAGDGEEGAVIDFNARRREDPEDTLEDEMARLLDDLTGDTNRAG